MPLPIPFCSDVPVSSLQENLTRSKFWAAQCSGECWPWKGAVRSSFPTQHCLFCCSSTAALDCLRPRSPQTVSSLLSFQSFIPSISLCSWHIVKTQSMVSKWADRCVNSRVTNCPPWTKSEGFLGCGAFIVKIRAVGTLSE